MSLSTLYSGCLPPAKQNPISLDVQIVDLDAKDAGETWTEELIVSPSDVVFQEDTSIIVSIDTEI